MEILKLPDLVSKKRILGIPRNGILGNTEAPGLGFKAESRDRTWARYYLEILKLPDLVSKVLFMVLSFVFHLGNTEAPGLGFKE